MKKNGFTLAEVLITLSIIGVVATLTLPSLMSNTQEQQSVTAFRKAMNTLNEVAQMNAAVDGFDFSGIASSTVPSTKAAFYDGTGVLYQSIWAMMGSKAQVDASRSGSTKAAVNPGGGCANMNVIAFRDGTTLCYANTTTNGAANAYIQAVVDTNGKKAPNALSTCKDINCAVKANKNIKDQYKITLHGAVALPGSVSVAKTGGYVDIKADNAYSYAARWAMSK